MARIRQEDIEAVRERTDLARLVQQYVALKKSGRRWSGLCPFHTEKTPSFSVDPAQGLFYCFGCGKGGNAFHFLMEVEGLEFPEAVERLAGQTGITLRYEGASPGERRAASRKQALYRANGRAAELYHRHLLDHPQAEQARAYLESRGINKASIEEFGVGYAPGFPDFLLRRLAKDLSAEILVEAGLALRDPRGGTRDRFRSRVVFPVHDLTGKPVGFGARLLEGEGPKYLNSPETPVYRKGEILYNLNRGRTALTGAGRAFVVEGYTDVIALHQAGIPTAVATCGTALSEGHLRLLSRFCPRAVLAFDSDEAGARAAERAHGMFEEFALEVSVLILPEGQDPADFVSRHGGEDFERLADKAQPLVDYMLERSVRDKDLSTPEGKARAWRDALPIVAGLKQDVLRGEYAGRLADLVGVSPTDIALELERAGQPAPRGRTERRAQDDRAAAEARSPVREVEREALKLLAQYPDISSRHLDRVGEDYFETQRYRKVLALLRGPWRTSGELADKAADQGLAQAVAELTLEPLKGDPTDDYALRVFSRLEERSLKRRMDTMRKRLERLNPVTDADSFDPLFRELTDVTGRWREAKARAGEGA
jgi:DNA primase